MVRTGLRRLDRTELSPATTRPGRRFRLARKLQPGTAFLFEASLRLQSAAHLHRTLRDHPDVAQATPGNPVNLGNISTYTLGIVITHS